MQLVLSLASKSIHLTYSKALNILLETLLMLLFISLYLPHRPASLSLGIILFQPLTTYAASSSGETESAVRESSVIS